FVTAAETEKILEAFPDKEWRLIVALTRYGGLRCPSQLLALTWPDVDWDRGRLLVKAPKTAHHADGGRCWVPLFPQLRPHLEAMFKSANPGKVYVVGRARCHETNLQTAFERIIYRAGLLPWPKLFQNMRASRETELAQTFSLHVVTAWIGNSARIAAKHYVQVTEADFQRAAEEKESLVLSPAKSSTGGARAAHNPAQSGADPTRLEMPVVPAEMQKALDYKGFHSGTSQDTMDQYARQDSNL